MESKEKNLSEENAVNEANSEVQANDEINGQNDNDQTVAREESAEQEIDPHKRIEELNDQYLRLFAEFDNFRKRTRQEKYEFMQMASASLIKELLPVIDDFERSFKNMDESAKQDPIVEGYALIYNKLMNILKAQGLKAVEALGQNFDTDFHEAVTSFPVEEESKKGQVIDELEKGYVLNDKIIRHAKVVVGQ